MPKIEILILKLGWKRQNEESPSHQYGTKTGNTIEAFTKPCSQFSSSAKFCFLQTISDKLCTFLSAAQTEIYNAKKLSNTLNINHHLIKTDKTSMGSYRSCATLLNISNLLKYLVEFSLVLVSLGLVWLVWFDLF